jgi:hypothetical protein
MNHEADEEIVGVSGLFGTHLRPARIEDEGPLSCPNEDGIGEERLHASSSRARELEEAIESEVTTDWLLLHPEDPTCSFKLLALSHESSGLEAQSRTHVTQGGLPRVIT